MSIIQRIVLILEKKNKRMSDLSAFIGVNTSTSTNWKKRDTDPPAKFIAPICEFLDVSPSYLLTGKSLEVTNASPSLTEDQQRILALYDPLDQDGKDIVRAACLTEKRRMQKELENSTQKKTS